jgi:eukaryotic-like serine/threonine-protein kinase
MLLAPGTRLGPYEILAPLGAGGMGEVYRARDSRLGRDVAIKVLPQHLSAQPEIRARFEREARTVSSLNHPNICTLFDVGREGDTDFLVMELIEGDTLAARLQKGPLSAPELLRFGTQIADALDRAHRAGVIHRDLKPANVMLTRSGAKLMDFGLSRATEMSGPGSSSGHTMAALTQSPTVAQALTAEGTLLGTFQYMSPEQLEGGEADVRSDIWALGCVLYEMATGRRAFEGRSQASLIAAILERQPASVGESASGSSVVGGPPVGLDRLIRNCLAKDPEERIQTAHDVKLQLMGIAEGAGLSATNVASVSVLGAPSVARGGGAGAHLPWVVAIVALLAGAAGFAWLWPLSHAPAMSVRFRLGAIPHTIDSFWPRVSPDGKYLVVEAVDSTGIPRAWLRPMNEVDVRPIPGTEGANRVYWSPDSREIAFVVAEKMQRVSITGSAPTLICAAPGGADLSWGSRGLILMDGRTTDSLRVVAAGGGELKPASRVDRAGGEIGSAWPCFLPDGEHFLFLGNLPSGTGGPIRLGRIGSLDSKVLGHSDGRVEYAAGGWVLFTRGSALLAQKLDLGGARLTGEPITIVDDLRIGSSFGHFSASKTGVLAMARLAGNEQNELHVADRRGAQVGASLLRGAITSPQPSPDGRRLLYRRGDDAHGQGGEIYVYDLERATDTRLTFTGNFAATPVWSPDGRRFAFVTRASATSTQLRTASADGLGATDSITIPNNLGASLSQWTADGTQLVFFSSSFRSYAIATAGTDRAAHAIADTASILVQSQFSADGRWVACVSGTSANPQVFVETPDGQSGRWQISTTSGIFPRWTRGGKELVYETIEGMLMAVDIDTGNGFHAGTPRPLFRLPSHSFGPDQSSWSCDSAGERFFLVVPPTTQTVGFIEVATDFHSLVNRK